MLQLCIFRTTAVVTLGAEQPCAPPPSEAVPGSRGRGPARRGAASRADSPRGACSEETETPMRETTSPSPALPGFPPGPGAVTEDGACSPLPASPALSCGLSHVCACPRLTPAVILTCEPVEGARWAQPSRKAQQGCPVTPGGESHAAGTTQAAGLPADPAPGHVGGSGRQPIRRFPRSCFSEDRCGLRYFWCLRSHQIVVLLGYSANFS